jgi:ribonuclease-3
MPRRSRTAAFTVAGSVGRRVNALPTRKRRRRTAPATAPEASSRALLVPVRHLSLCGCVKHPDFNLANLEQRLRYRFSRYPELAKLAFSHPASSNGDGHQRLLNNERLEFLGDAILSAVVADSLYRQLPEAREGELSVIRAAVVSREACAKYFARLGLEEFLEFGPVPPPVYERLSRTQNIRANAFEAILGAIYIDGGYEAALEFFLMHFAEDLIHKQIHPVPNYKSVLQEWASQQKEVVTELPSYEILKKSGAAHSPHFDVRVCMRVRGAPEPIECLGSGRTRKQAEQVAAKALLQLMGVPIDRNEPRDSQHEAASALVEATAPLLGSAAGTMHPSRLSHSNGQQTSSAREQRVLWDGRQRRQSIDDVRRSTDLEMVIPAAYGGAAASLATVCQWIADAYTVPVAMACLSHFALTGSIAANQTWMQHPLIPQLIWAVVLDRSLLTLADDAPVETVQEMLPSGQRMIRVYSSSDAGDGALQLDPLAPGAESANFFVARRLVVPRSEKTLSMGMFVRFQGCLVPQRNDFETDFISDDITQAWLTALVATVALMFVNESSSALETAERTEPTVPHSHWTGTFVREAVQEWSDAPGERALARLRLACSRILQELSGYGLLRWNRRNRVLSLHASLLLQFARTWLLL